MGMKSKPLTSVRQDLPVHLAKAEELVQLNIKIPESVRYELRLIALKDSTQVNTLVREAINSYLSSYPNRQIAK